MLNENTKNKTEIYHIKSSKGGKKRKLTAQLLKYEQVAEAKGTIIKQTADYTMEKQVLYNR